jgi:hypothetical protein
VNKNKILIGCSVTLAISLMLAAVVGYYVYRQIRNFYASIHPEPPAEIQQPRVLVGQDLFEKKFFLDAKRLGDITTIVYGKLHPGHEPELWVVGNTGAIFLDGQGNQIESVTFEKEKDDVLGLKVEGTNRRSGQIDVVDVDGDLVNEFLIRNDLLNGAELIGHDGKSIWKYDESDKKHSFLDDMTAGDIDGDGKAEYVAAYLNGKGLVLLDHSLKEIWSKPEIHAHTVEMVDTDGSGKMKILYSDHVRHLSLRDASGNVISDGETDHSIYHLSLVRWPSKKDRQYVVDFSDDVIWLMDFNGKTVKAFKAPLVQNLYRMHAVAVKLKPNEPQYLAAIAGFKDRSVLYVYSSTGDMVYQEVLPADYESIVAYPVYNTGQESILLGGRDEVLQYKMNIAPQGTLAH